MYRLFICLRYLRKRPTALGAVLAVTFGVAVLLTVMSIMEGYIVELRAMIRDQDSHMVVRARRSLGLCGLETIEEAIRRVPHVVGVAPSIETIAMYRSDSFSPCLIRGVVPEQEIDVTAIGKFFLRPAEVEAILAVEETEREREAKRVQAEREPMDAPEIERLFSLEHRRDVVATLPEALRERLVQRGNRPPSAVIVGLPFLLRGELSVGQIVKIMTTTPENSELVEGTFLVCGAFKTGNFDLDSRMFFVHNRRMRTLMRAVDPFLGESCCELFRVALDHYDNAVRSKELITRELATLPEETGATTAIVLTWEDQKRRFLEAVEIEKWIMGFVVSLLNLFTTCIILLMLVLLVIEKTRDSGVLLAIGATPRGVFSIFLVNGLVITTVGTVLGLGLGLLFTQNINAVHDWIHAVTGYRLFDSEVYLMDRIPIRTTLTDVVVTALPALAFGFFASLVPALWAARKDPIKAIHHE